MAPIQMNSPTSLLFCSLLLCLSVMAEDKGNEAWKLRKDKNEIQVYSRLAAGLKYEEFKAVVELDATLVSSLSLLDDAEACVDWIYRCELSRVVHTTGLLERHIYQVSSLPFPAASRDMILKATVFLEDAEKIRIGLESRPGFIKETTNIRIKEAHGSYLLEKLDENHTRLTWIQYVDPAGALPAFIVNSMLTNLPYKSLENFRKVVKRKKYRDSKIIQHEDGSSSLVR